MYNSDDQLVKIIRSHNYLHYRHYLVPLSLAQKSRWKKKGTKLHIFNDHTFIAKHMSG